MSPGVDAGREGSSRAVDELRDAHVGSDRERRERLSCCLTNGFSQFLCQPWRLRQIPRRNSDPNLL